MPPTRKTETARPYPGAPTDIPADRKAPVRRRTAKKLSSPPPPLVPVASSGGGDERYAPTTWGAGVGAVLEDVTVPSGQLCQVRRPGVEGLLKAGVLNDIDSLTQIVNTKVKKARGQKVEELDMKALAADPVAIENVMHTTDRIVCYIVVQPQIVMTPNDPTRRENGVIYADMVDIEDKMFLLNYAVGGTRDLERFRGELSDAVRDLDSGEDVAD